MRKGLIVLCLSMITIFVACDCRENNGYISTCEKEHQALYTAWVKQYGNPNHLTLDEFYATRVTIVGDFCRGYWQEALPPVGWHGDTKGETR